MTEDTAVSSSTIENPYVGPRTFTYAQRRLFFGRDREARDLLARVVSERVLLFYAQSGAGKSSLLHTRLIPQLREEEGFAVLPVGRVSGELPAGVGRVENIYLFNLMASLDQSNVNPVRLARLTLSDFLARLTSGDGERWRYVDQEDDQEEPQSTDAASIAPATNGSYAEQRYALLIDQFEEIITTHPDHWREREGFFRQLNQALLADPNLWVVLTLREDYVAALDPYAQWMADKLRARFYMERMGVTAALEAVCQPAALAGHPFADGVAKTLVDNLRRIKVLGQAEEQLGQYIEPVQLQVVCYQLWAKIIAAGERISREITMTDLQQSGDVNTALADFYNQALTNVLQHADLNLSERRLRSWVNEELITEAGTRGTVYQGLADTAGMPNPIVKLLTDQFLLRTEQRAGGYWVELVHDRFVEPIRQANAQWRAQYQNPLATAYQRWQAGGQRDEFLLCDDTLREAQLFVEARANDVTHDEQDFLQRSSNEEKRRSETIVQQAQNQRRNRMIAATTLLAVVLALLVGIIGYIALEARRARADAVTKGVAAAAAQQIAEAESQRADQEKARAQEERQYALIQASNAAIARAKQLAAQVQVADFPEEKLLLGVEAVTTTYTLSDTHGGLQVAMANQSLRQAVQSANGLPRLLHPDAVYDVTFSPDNQWLASASADYNVRLWSRDHFTEPLRLLAGHTGFVFDLAFHPSGKLLASASADRTVRLWSLADPGAAPAVLQGHTDGIARITFSPDGRWLASASTDQTVQIWPMTDPGAEPTTPAIVLHGHTDRIYDAVFSPDSQLLASASQDKTVRIWQVNQPDTPPIVLTHEDGVAALAFSPDGALFASASWDKKVRLWRIQDLTSPPIILAGHEEAVRTLAFSPDQRWLVTAGNDGLVNAWSLADLQQEPVVLHGMSGQIYDVTFSANSQWLAAAGQYGATRLWQIDPLQSDPIMIEGQTSDIWSINFSDDNQWLASASLDGSVQLWPLAMARMIELACQRAGRNFNALEWERYFGDEPYHRTCLLWPVHASMAEAAYRKGKALAEAGQLTAAIAQFEQALTLEPSRDLDPAGEAARLQQQAQAARLQGEGGALAQTGDVTGAVAKFKQAVALNAELGIDPDAEAARIYQEVQRAQAQQLLTQGQALAQKLDITGAIDLFTQAAALDSTLALEPERTAKRLAAQTLLSQGRQLAQRGDTATAMETYTTAQRYDPTLVLNPPLEVQVEYGRGLANRGAYAAAMQALAAAQAISPTLDLTRRLFPYEWDQICYRGSLANVAAAVLPACERAVLLQPENGNSHANRGIARALLNDIEGAIADFQFYTSWARQDPTQGATIGGRQAWIAALKVGINPIQAYVLARDGKVEQALQIYSAFRTIEPPLQLTADEWNNLCWYGSLVRQVDKVFYACEWAVMLAPTNGNFHDSRGLARALRGDLVGAAEDFEYYLFQSGETILPATRNRRLAWVQALRAGMNPILADSMTRNGEIDIAVALYTAIDAAQPPLPLTAEEWNNLCWHGSLAVRAAKVLFACDRAVAQEPTNGNYHDSRSLARTLTGDLPGAIADLEFAVEWASDNNMEQTFIVDRRFWLFVLRAAQFFQKGELVLDAS